MVDIFKTTFSNAFTSERIIVLLLTLYNFAISIIPPYWQGKSSIILSHGRQEPTYFT